MGLKEELKQLIREVLLEGFEGPDGGGSSRLMAAGPRPGRRRRTRRGRVKNPEQDRRLKRNRAEGEGER